MGAGGVSRFRIEWSTPPPEPGDLLVSEPGGSWYLVDAVCPVKTRAPTLNPVFRVTALNLGRGYRAMAENHAGAAVHTFHWHGRNGERRECPYC